MLKGSRPNRATWFRKAGFTTILSIPTTPGSIMAREIKTRLQGCSSPGRTRTGVMEGGGRTVGQILSGKRNPFPRQSCMRKECPLEGVEGGCKGLCYKEGVGYSGHCNRCKVKQVEDFVPADQAIDWSYQGETSPHVHCSPGLLSILVTTSLMWQGAPPTQ